MYKEGRWASQGSKPVSSVLHGLHFSSCLWAPALTSLRDGAKVNPVIPKSVQYLITATDSKRAVDKDFLPLIGCLPTWCLFPLLAEAVQFPAITFCDCVLSLNRVVSGFSPVKICVSTWLPFISKQWSIVWYTIFYSFTVWLTQIFAIFHYKWCGHLHTYLCGYMSSFLLRKYLGMEAVGHW